MFFYNLRPDYGGGGCKTNLNKKVGRLRQFLFVYNLRSEYIFFELHGKAGRGGDSLYNGG